METRPFGKTGLRVSVVALGAGQVGAGSVTDEEAERLLHGVLDAGVTLIDTARSYGLSEERIGRALARRRDEFVLSSKCGYGIAGVADWTGAAVTRGIEEALVKLRTDRIDIMHLHSCPLDVLQRGDVLRALDDARESGKIRVAAYSGENDALQFAIEGGRFGSLQTSVNICDQRGLSRFLPAARKGGMGVIAKRPLANAFWRHAQRPIGNYCEEYWRRAQQMSLSPGAMHWTEFAARFTAYAPGVDTIIVGTSSLKHFAEVLRAVESGPLPAETLEEISSAFAQHGQAWTGEI